MFSKKLALQEIRCAAKINGLTFRQANTRFNGAYLYELIVRKTGEVLISNYLFSSAYNDVCSGYICSWNGSEFEFNKGY
jgi:hypothetical protein